ncbi:hypothetical protein MOB65_20090 [Bacillus inaquosorum]|uniref:hypothetical protein n=1 Tax=Bacillus inaquosorum TaxID=483913 RepID=UPI0022824F5E|nr:hypothetical protein [Bacillus inaquosorum]MCY7911158.1 hypothetical protein [Bacillus inaquosorum]MED3440270.1 hypothetical protein [Bacillus subtilis]MED3474641.1 hypothetical protein [Bacillus subtilis]
MKSIKEIVSQEPIFLHEWKDQESVLTDFDGEQWNDKSDKKVSRDVNILFASYGNEVFWDGAAFVLFEKEGKLYEVSGKHCSCYGLEGQWEPEEVVLKELENRLVNGVLGEDDYSSGNKFKEELCRFLGVEYKLNSD